MENYIIKSNFLKAIDTFDIKNFINNRDFVLKKLNKNTILHIEGDVCDKVEIVLYGKIAVERIDEDGSIMSVVEFTEDDLIGGNLIFSSNPYYPMTITSKQDCAVLQIKKDLLLTLFEKYPNFTKAYLEYISDNTYMLGFKIRHYVNRSIRDSLISFLQHERKVQKSNKIILNMTKKKLAEKIGVQRTSLSRELSKMKADRIIDFDLNSITILTDF